MTSETVVGVLSPGDRFRDWLVEIAAERVRDPGCEVIVSRLRPASHVVCKYEFTGSGYAVVGKFFARPTGSLREYDAARAMENEYRILHRMAKVIPTPRPLAMRKDFNCVLVTEYVEGSRLSSLLRGDWHSYRHFTTIANLHRQLHDLTVSAYDKKREFAAFHSVLDHLDLNHGTREEFNQLLGKWWRAPFLDRERGCTIHRDATLANYLFHNGIVYALDFESTWNDAHPVHDPGIFCAELKHFFQFRKGSGELAEPYIGHYLWHYSKDESDFIYNTDVLPFFMGLGYLRIARLNWKPSYRDWLIGEARACLRSRV